MIELYIAKYKVQNIRSKVELLEHISVLFKNYFALKITLTSNPENKDLFDL